MIINIQRFNPEKDEKTYIQSYEIENQLLEGKTIFEALEYIKDKIDSTLTFRAFCRSGICGSCAMRVNENYVLACNRQITKLAINNEITIKPLRGKIIKDLVIKQDDGFEKLKNIKAWCEYEEKDLNEENLITPEEFEKTNLQTDCILCMSCYSACDIVFGDEKFAGPFAFTKNYRFYEDKRDTLDRLEISQQNNIFSCVDCNACVLACPKGIMPAMDIKKLKNNLGNFNGFGDFNDFGVDFSSF